MMRASLATLTEKANRFRNDRSWAQFHDPKDVALSLSLEASEVLELMQWRSGRELQKHLGANREALADELSDVLYWILLLAHDQGIDLAEAFETKLHKNAAKYPASKAKGNAKKYTEL